MQYWSIYGREHYPTLEFVMSIWAGSSQDALDKFVEEYGDNYGKVVVLPTMSTSTHHAFG